MILDTIFIFLLGLGIDGAALATVISEYVNDVVKLKHIFSSRDVRFLEISVIYSHVLLLIPCKLQYQVLDCFYPFMEVE